MGGGKGATKIPVADYLMSIHFGICYGKLDSINQVYIKEQPVWCGEISENSVVFVHRPKVFGGDKKEGGVSGAMECYLGEPDQVMLPTAAARYGRTPATMTGYRGLANIMCRGFHPEELGFKVEDDTPDYFGVPIADWSALFADPGATPASSGGFKWISNNPYLPGAWVNATRIPRGLDVAFSTIYSQDPDYLEETPMVGGVDFSGDTYFPIAALGRTVAEVDGGLITARVSIAARFVGTGIAAGTPMSGFIGVEFQCYQDSAGSPGTSIPGGFFSDGAIYESSGAASASGTLPPGTRWIRVLTQVLESSTFFTETVIEDEESVTGKMIYGPSYCSIDNHLGVLPDANPAHMIYEALTDRGWAMGTPREGIDIPSFMYAAETFYNEKFGLSILWSEQTEIEKYIGEILDHVQATLFLDPMTGLWRLVPFRADYDVGTLATLDPSNCKANNRQRKALGETVNEVVITWTNPNNEQEETLVFHDNGNLAAQGVPVSTTRNYYGVRNAALANLIGQRDIRSASYPLFGADIVANRSISRDVYPGAVLKFSWPDDGIVDMPVRVMKVDYGKPGEGSIKLSITEDIWGLDVTEYTTTVETGWIDPDSAPTPFDHVEFLTAPLPLLLRSGYVLEDLSDADYPIVRVGVLAKEDADSVEYFELYGDVVKPTAEVVRAKITTLLPTDSGLTTLRFHSEGVSRISAVEIQRFCGSNEIESGEFLHIEGPDGDRSSEIIMLDELVDGFWIIARGMFDTVPRDWPIGTRVWYLGDDLGPLDPSEENAFVPVEYQLRPKNGGGLLPLDEAPEVTFTPTDRPYAPFRPANVQFAPVGGGAVLTTYPIELVNGSGDSGIGTGWTHVNMGTLTVVEFLEATLNPYLGTRFFYPLNGFATAYMEQYLSIPYTLRSEAVAGSMEMNIRWWQAGADSINDTARVEVDFYDDTAALISTFVGPETFGGHQKWAPRQQLIPIPALTQDYRVRFNFTRTDGSNINVYVDGIEVSLAGGQHDILAFTTTEIPTSFTITWANRDRLAEDTVAPRWGEPNITPEVGQTVTIRVRDVVDNAIETEITGLTGTSYSLDTTGLSDYRFYQVEVLSERDGFESIQFAWREVELVRLGYGNNYGYDYGENDGDV